MSSTLKVKETRFWEPYSFPIWNTFNNLFEQIVKWRLAPHLVGVEMVQLTMKSMLRGKVKYCSTVPIGIEILLLFSSQSCHFANCFHGFHGINLASSVEYRVSSSMVASCRLPCNNLRSSPFLSTHCD